MSAHTPGPWRLTFTGKGRPVVSRDDAPPLFVETSRYSDLHHIRDTVRELADAYLIAAAPDLLEALTMVRDADNDCHKDGLPTIPQPARAKIDEAIAKATGENA